MSCRGVISKANGDLLRAGYANFQTDGSLDLAKEEYHPDVPVPAYPKGDGPLWHRWTGTAWTVMGDLVTAKKITRILRLRDEVTAYIGKHYDAGQQGSLQALWVEGIDKVYPNRKAKVQSVLDWVKTVLSYFYAKKAALSAAVTEADIDAVTWDLSTFDAADPLVTVEDVKNTET